MSLWIREFAGWALILIGLLVFAGVYDFLASQLIFDGAILLVAGIFIFRGGIHLLKVAVAARIYRETLGAPSPAATKEPWRSSLAAQTHPNKGQPRPVGRAG
jgi:hypothetical protein